MNSSSIPKEVDKLVRSLLVVLVESIVDDENTIGFFPGLELDGDAVSKLDVFIEAVDAEISTSFPKDVDEIV